MSHHEDTPVVVTQQQLTDDAGGVDPRTVGTTTDTVIGETDENGKKAMSNDDSEICGGAAMVSKRIVVDIDQNITNMLTGNDGYVADKEAGPERWALAKTVETHS